MKKRKQRFWAIVISCILLIQLFPITALAEEVDIGMDTTYEVDSTTDPNNTYVFKSGSVLVVKDGGVVNTDLNLQTYGRLSVEAGGVVNGSINLSSNVNGSISGAVADVYLMESFLDINSASIGNLTNNSVHFSTITVNGTNTIGNLTTWPSHVQGDIGGKIYVTESVNLANAGSWPSTISLEVTETTRITNASPGLEVICNGEKYPIPSTVTSATISDIYTATASVSQLSFEEKVGYSTAQSKTFTMSNAGEGDVFVELPFPDDFKVDTTATQADTPDWYSIPSGESIEFTVTPVTGKSLGEYTEDIGFNIYCGELNSSGMYPFIKTMVVPAGLVVGKIEGTGNVQVPNSYYGGSYSAVVKSDTNGVGNVVVQYKVKGTDDSTYTTVRPTGIGDYVVKAIFAETADTKEAVATDEFSISYLPAPAQTCVLTGTAGENDYLIGDLTINAPEGYLLSTQFGGKYSESIPYSQDITTVYLKKSLTGEMTGEIKVDFSSAKIDTTIPVISGVSNGETLYKDVVSVVVKDDNLRSVTVNGDYVSYYKGQAFINLDSKGAKEEFEIVVTDVAGHQKSIKVTVAAAWLEKGIVPSGTAVKLSAAEAYTLGSGSWKVEGDSTTYAGGNQFYVRSAGQYVFTQQ